jgi:hypothetical protein
LLREIIQTTNAHIYSSAGELFYAGNGMLTVHTQTGGRRVIQLKNKQYVVLDLPDGPATVLLDAETGEILLE